MWKYKLFTSLFSGAISGVEKAREELAEFLNEQNLSKHDFFLEEHITTDSVDDDTHYLIIMLWYKMGVENTIQEMGKELEELKKHLAAKMTKAGMTAKATKTAKELEETKKELEEIKKKLEEIKKDLVDGRQIRK